MNAPGLRERKKIRRREAIVTTALRLFADRGYDATTISDIADAADVAPRTVLTYFATKEDIAMAPVDEIAARISEALRTRVVGETAIEVFARWLREEVRLTKSDPTVKDLLGSVFEKNPRLAGVQMARVSGVVTEFTQALADDIGCEPDDPGPDIVVAAATGVISHVMSGIGKESRAETVELAIAFLAAGTERLRDERVGS